MKALIRFLFFLLLPVFISTFLSCEKRNDNTSLKGKAEFTLSMPEATAKSSSDGTSDSGFVSYHILVTIEDMNGNSIVTDSLIPIYAFGPSFTSENIELEAGEYKLTKFLVIDPSGVVVLAAPLENSPLSYLVNDPLPVQFNILSGQITEVAPEVLVVGNNTPGQFGYATFGIRIIRPLQFWAICILDCPMCMRPTLLTTAKLTVISADGWRYTFKLEEAPNNLIIRGGSEFYYFLLEKEGYLPQRLQFTAKELLITTKESPLVLRIPWDSNQWKTLVLQPGPENGKDAMISNLEPDRNFGDHKYFETTFLSEPILTVMRSNRSLIWFSLNDLPASAVIIKAELQLWYDIPVPWDPSIVVTDSVGSPLWFGAVLQQVVEPWEENMVTWNNQPKSVEANQVYISPFIKNANFLTVDVTSLYTPAAGSVAPNYGMMFKLWPSEKFPGFRFASSDYPDAAMRPMLTIYYTLN